MTANLGNIYAFLMRRYGENYTITYTFPPTYIKNILGSNHLSNDKIVLFYKEVSYLEYIAIEKDDNRYVIIECKCKLFCIDFRIVAFPPLLIKFIQHLQNFSHCLNRQDLMIN